MLRHAAMDMDLGEKTGPVPLERSRGATTTLLYSEVVKVPERPNPKSEPRFTHMHDEIVRSILCRLPIKSLGRFKCVNRNWNTMISERDFTLSLSSGKSKAIFMSSHGTHLLFLFIDSDGHIESFPWRRSRKAYNYLQRTYHINPYEFLGGSCNGLLLVVMGQSFFLWNPLTAYFAKVLELGLLNDHVDFAEYAVTSGLCYDAFTDDFKVLIWFCHGKGPDFGGKFFLVASLKEKIWKEVSFPDHFYVTGKGPLFNGFLHWEVHNDHSVIGRFGTPNKFLAFDPKTDEFKELQVPRNQKGYLGLGILCGYLCMAQYKNTNGSFSVENNIEILAMKDYGNKESWAALFEISISNSNLSSLPSSLKPLLLLNNGQFLLMVDDELLIYDPPRKTYKKIKVNGGNFWRCVYSEDLFVESLVSPTICEWDKQQHEGLGSEIIWEKGTAPAPCARILRI